MGRKGIADCTGCAYEPRSAVWPCAECENGSKKKPKYTKPKRELSEWEKEWAEWEKRERENGRLR